MLWLVRAPEASWPVPCPELPWQLGDRSPPDPDRPLPVPGACGPVPHPSAPALASDRFPESPPVAVRFPSAPVSDQLCRSFRFWNAKEIPPDYGGQLVVAVAAVTAVAVFEHDADGGSGTGADSDDGDDDYAAVADADASDFRCSDTLNWHRNWMVLPDPDPMTMAVLFDSAEENDWMAVAVQALHQCHRHRMR